MAGRFHNLFPLTTAEIEASSDTIGQHIAYGNEIRARCTNIGCNHNVPLNLMVVARYLGPDHGARAADLKPYFFCPTCRDEGRYDKHIEFTRYACIAPSCAIDHRENQRQAA
jgi:hypothetical protein